MQEGSAAAEDFPTEELELVVLSFISDPPPWQVQELTAAAARLPLTTVAPFPEDTLAYCVTRGFSGSYLENPFRNWLSRQKGTLNHSGGTSDWREVQDAVLTNLAEARDGAVDKAQLGQSKPKRIQWDKII